MISALLRLLAGAGLALLIIPWGWLQVLAAWQARPQPWPQDALALAVGLALAALLMWLRRPSQFLHTLLHECAHALVCVLLWVPVLGFQVTRREGGHVRHGDCDPLRSTLIAVAPYTLPLLLLPALLARWLLPAGHWRTGLSGACGFLLLQHLHGLVWNLRANFLGRDSDFAHSGRLLGAVLVLAALLLLAVALLRVLWSSAPPWT